MDLPRLIPSFSSKGFPFVGTKKNVHSVVANSLALTGPHLKQSFLISAYDIHHQLIPNSAPFIENAELVFLDSGAYELSGDYDSTEAKQPSHAPLQFHLADYRRVLSSLPKRSQIVVSNFDWATRKKSLEEQITAARALANKHPHFLFNFIIKPGNERLLDIDDVIKHIKHMRSFDVIGVTEKELGDNLIDRLRNIARLRATMDRENIRAPLHIWGGLDPIITVLYFFVGAEIFDGVSWLRYAYYRGTAVYRDAYAVLHPEIGVMEDSDHTRSLALSHNLLFLRDLTTSLRRFVDGKAHDFSMFGDTRETFERAYQRLACEIPELRRAE